MASVEGKEEECAIGIDFVEAYLWWHIGRLGSRIACLGPTKRTTGIEAIIGARIHGIIIDRVQAAGRC